MTMRNSRWTRREFLEASAVAAAMVGGIQPAAAAVFTVGERETLRAAMDEIIPASDQMPAASEVGGVDYLERMLPQLEGAVDEFREGLAEVDATSRKRFSQPFIKLGWPDRVAVLKTLESDGGFFVMLRDFVYEAYYTHPEVGKRIGYHSHLTDEAGPRMAPFDEAVLAQVRKRSPLYREVE